jgi:hypothetical protein
MASTFSLTGDEASRAMLDGLTSRIRSELRELILKRIEPDIEAAIDASIDALKLTIESYRDPAYLRDTVRVIVERKALVTPHERPTTE